MGALPKPNAHSLFATLGSAQTVAPAPTIRFRSMSVIGICQQLFLAAAEPLIRIKLSPLFPIVPESSVCAGRLSKWCVSSDRVVQLLTDSGGRLLRALHTIHYRNARSCLREMELNLD